jgi:surfeit locus 1 family protein
MPGRAGLLSSEPKRFQGLIGPTFATCAALLVLIGLGTWQLQRLQWKLGLIEAIAERVHAPPVAIETLLARGPLAIASAEYTHVALMGQFQHPHERYLYAPGDGDWGWDVFTPLELADGEAIFVNRGYVPRQRLDRALRPSGLPQGPVTITGLLRQSPGAPPWWTPASNPAKNAWYWSDIGAMANSLGPNEGRLVTDFYVDADPIQAVDPPAGGATGLELPNRHLEYAFTWFGLAATLLVIYAIFVARRLRSPTA